MRKVLVLLELKGIAYRIDPIVPFFGDEAFEAPQSVAPDTGAGGR